MCIFRAFQVALVVKNRPAAGDIRDVGSIPGSGRSPGRGHGNTLQYSSLEDPMDRGAWWATVHRVPKSWTQLSYKHAHITKLDPVKSTDQSLSDDLCYVVKVVFLFLKNQFGCN